MVAIGPLLAVGGDLFESAMKRFFRVKDSYVAGFNVFPGHGGVLDRIDALVWVTSWVFPVSVCRRRYSRLRSDTALASERKRSMALSFKPAFVDDHMLYAIIWRVDGGRLHQQHGVAYRKDQRWRDSTTGKAGNRCRNSRHKC